MQVNMALFSKNRDYRQYIIKVRNVKMRSRVKITRLIREGFVFNDELDQTKKRNDLLMIIATILERLGTILFLRQEMASMHPLAVILRTVVGKAFLHHHYH